jgi:membrane protein DedA with SNARE-associated domain
MSGTAASILYFIQAYQAVAVLLGTFILGETVVVSASFLSGGGLFSPLLVFVMAFVGTVAADMTWFFVGQYYVRRHEEKYLALRLKYPPVFRFVDHLTRSMPLWQALVAIKFVYGTRILFILYVSVNRLCRPLRFLILDVLGIFLWLTPLVAMGYLVGRGVLTETALQHTKWLIASCMIFVLSLKLASLWLKQRLVRE